MKVSCHVARSHRGRETNNMNSESANRDTRVVRVGIHDAESSQIRAHKQTERTCSRPQALAAPLSLYPSVLPTDCRALSLLPWQVISSCKSEISF